MWVSVSVLYIVSGVFRLDFTAQQFQSFFTMILLVLCFLFFSLVAEAGVNMKSTTSLSLENSCPWYFYWIKFENISVHNSGMVNCYPWKIYSWEPKWRHLWCGGTGSLTPWFIPFSNQIFFFWSTNIFFKKGKRTKPSLASSSVSIHPTLPSMI